jgi:ribulose-phosphate 3-epimerase
VSVRIAPSILSADFARLADEIAEVEAAGADLLHVDVMDGHFVPNITIGPPVVAAIRRVTKLPLDVHLMIADPDRYLEAFVAAGAAMITVHVEVLPHLHRTLTQIRKLGALPGAAINPSTPVAAVREVAAELNHLLVMSVNPGFGGQTFIPRSYEKVREARAMFKLAGTHVAIEVDGGVDPQNAGALAEAGTSLFVAGAAIFAAPDRASALQALRRAAEAAH